ncbi:heterokaryon incompatibility protein-domain-containing protein [Lasiosphaeria hispida]|uniref:Heterokaryon incompatibility protein-domain-containing protein n=1 Tax=Lasiosphaeria hispida TaxID=260671 RepID=A0AAJ0H7D5_9PEZI|nr:heterokaryon incompatibility protein-domain-containing protein [Lasiosphaeria hispida]
MAFTEYFGWSLYPGKLDGVALACCVCTLLAVYVYRAARWGERERKCQLIRARAWPFDDRNTHRENRDVVPAAELAEQIRRDRDLASSRARLAADFLKVLDMEGYETSGVSVEEMIFAMRKHDNPSQAWEWIQESRAVALSLLERAHDSGFCVACTRIARAGKEGVSHHSPVNLERSAELGCRLCELFSTSGGVHCPEVALTGTNLDPSTWTWTVESYRTSQVVVDWKRWKVRFKPSGGRVTAFVIFKANTPTRYPALGESGTCSHVEPVVDTHNARRPQPAGPSQKQEHQRQTSFNHSSVAGQETPYRSIADHAESDACDTLARSWLQDCLDRHSKCHHTGPAKAPTRLLEITDDRVFLRDTGNLPPLSPPPPYAALSYCWGARPTLKTTTSNLSSHRQDGILISTLPRTLADAVRVASRCVSVDYLWVDALCIIQDSVADWEAECSRMGDYYRNARATVSALSAASSSAGFLHERAEPRNGRVAPLYAHHAGDVWVRPVPPSRNDVFRAAPLTRRGWALQERLLATRVLHYTSSRLFWECLTCTMSEGTTEAEAAQTDMSELVYSEGEDFKRCLWPQQEQQTCSNAGTEVAGMISAPIQIDHHCIQWGTFSLWYRLVGQFSSMELTVASDRIPAIGAIAERIGYLTGSRYAYGLFVSDLSGLCWLSSQAGPFTQTEIAARSTRAVASRNDSKHTEQQLIRAGEQRLKEKNRRWAESVDKAELQAVPSWSWGSATSQVSFPFRTTSRVSSDRDAHFISWEDGGRVLRIRARFTPVSWDVNKFVNAETKRVVCWPLGGVFWRKENRTRLAVVRICTREEVVVGGRLPFGHNRERQVREGTQHWDKPEPEKEPTCECHGKVSEAVVYYLVVADVGGGGWERAGVAVDRVAAACANETNRKQFEGAEERDARLV